MAKSSRLPAQTERIREKTDQRITTRSHIRYVRDVRNVLGFLSLLFYFPYFSTFYFALFYFYYFTQFVLFCCFDYFLNNRKRTERRGKFIYSAERVPLSDEHFSDFPPNLISGFM